MSLSQSVDRRNLMDGTYRLRFRLTPEGHAIVLGAFEKTGQKHRHTALEQIIGNYWARDMEPEPEPELSYKGKKRFLVRLHLDQLKTYIDAVMEGRVLGCTDESILVAMCLCYLGNPSK